MNVENPQQEEESFVLLWRRVSLFISSVLRCTNFDETIACKEVPNRNKLNTFQVK